MDSSNVPKTYIGSTSQELKNRVSFHRSCMRQTNMKNFCELSKEVHKIRNNNLPYSVNWKIIEKSKSFEAGDEYCKLCISEMYHILYNDKPNALNSLRMMPCLHKKKGMLADVT